MAAHGGHAAVKDLGNQIFVTLVGKDWPPATCDVRVRYDQTIGDLKKAVAKKLGCPPEAQQLFWHGRELTAAAYDAKTLLDMEIHTGFGISGYDLAANPSPDYWPPVTPTDQGLAVVRR